MGHPGMRVVCQPCTGGGLGVVSLKAMPCILWQARVVIPWDCLRFNHRRTKLRIFYGCVAASRWYVAYIDEALKLVGGA